MRRAAFAALVAAALASACAPVTPPPAASSVALPDRFALLDAERAQAASPDGLLPVDDPGFIALRDRAMASAPDLEAALARIDQARAGLRAAGAARMPLFTADATAETQRISGAQFGGAANPAFDANRNLYQAGINASWDLDLFGELRASQRAAAARLDAAGADAAAVRLALATDIARGVNSYRTLAVRRAVIEADIAEARDRLDLVGARSKAGLVPEADTVRARAALLQTQARLRPIEQARAEALAQLTALTALPLVEVRAILEQNAGQGDPAPLPALAVPSVLLRARPDVLAAEYRLAAADAEVAAAAARRFPKLSITGALGLIALSIGDLFDDDALIGSLGAGLSGPLLDFGRVGAEIDSAEAVGREAFADYRGALFRAMADVEAALGAIAALDAQVAELSAQNAADRDAQTLAMIRYRRGLSDFLAVLDADRSARASAEALAIARGAAREQRILLWRAIGGSGE